MIARRGNVRLIQSDNSSNFLGAENELKRAFLELDNKKISQFLQDKGADWIKWLLVSGNKKFNLQDQFSYHSEDS